VHIAGWQAGHQPSSVTLSVVTWRLRAQRRLSICKSLRLLF